MRDKKISYYERAFSELINSGVPQWFIRLYALEDLIYFSRIYFYRDMYDVEAKDGWYTTNGIALTNTVSDRNRKCYGELKNLGFPTWDEYRLLFDGYEYDQLHEFMDAYDQHREEWWQAAHQNRRTAYDYR